MKKVLILFLCPALFMLFPLSVCAMGTESHVQLVHIVKGTAYDAQITVFYASLDEAVKDAADGDIIEVFDNVTVPSMIRIPSGIELTFISGIKRENTAIFGQSAFEETDKNAVTRTVKKTFDGALFSVGENSNISFGNIILDGEGSMILLQKGGSVTVNGKTYRNTDNADGIEIPFDAGNVPEAETDQPGTAPGAEASRAESVLDAETSERLKQTAAQPESRWKTKRIAALAVTFLLVGLFSAVTVLAIKKKTRSSCK